MRSKIIDMVTIESTLENIMQLDYTSREMLLEILQKRQIEARRNDIAKAARHSIKEYRSGNIAPQTAEEIVKSLDLL